MIVACVSSSSRFTRHFLSKVPSRLPMCRWYYREALGRPRRQWCHLGVSPQRQIIYTSYGLLLGGNPLLVADDIYDKHIIVVFVSRNGASSCGPSKPSLVHRMYLACNEERINVKKAQKRD